MKKPTIASLQADLAAQKEWYEQRITTALDEYNKRQATFDERGKRIAEYEKQVAHYQSEIQRLQQRADRVTYLEGMIDGFARAGVLPPPGVQWGVDLAKEGSDMTSYVQMAGRAERRRD